MSTISSWRRRAVGLGLLLVPALALVAGCAKQRLLMPAPALYTSTPADLSQTTLESRKGPTTEVLYATDRQCQPDAGPDPYPPQRERFLRLGVAEVAIGPGSSVSATWEEIASQSASAKRDVPIEVSLRSVEDFGPLAESTIPFDPVREQAALPNVARIIAAARRLMGPPSH